MRSSWLLFVLLISWQVCFSQQTNDTSFVDKSIDYAIQQYEQIIDGQQLYYNGGAYIEPPRGIDEHPYFITDDFISGKIIFEGHTFENIALLYDITSDQVVSETPRADMFAINPEKLSAFDFSGHTFINLNTEAFANSLPRSGFYEVLHDGQSKLVALHDKQHQEKYEQSTISIYFDERTRHYILKKDRYHFVKSKKSILNVLYEQKKNLRSFIRKNDIKFNQDRSRALALVAAYYDTLISR